MPYPYDSEYTPPFPVLPIVLHNPENNRSTTSQIAHLDTGADGTIVPIRLLEQLDADEFCFTYMRSQWGERREISVYLVNIEIAGEHLSAIEVLADEMGNELLIGRNVLNRLILLLDGFQHQTDVLTRRPRKL